MINNQKPSTVDRYIANKIKLLKEFQVVKKDNSNKDAIEAMLYTAVRKFPTRSYEEIVDMMSRSMIIEELDKYNAFGIEKKRGAL